MKDPMIAAIDLRSEGLQGHRKQIAASEMLRKLKARKQAEWASYKGFAEILVSFIR